jgi:preprotein translocase subunit Sec61beta
MENEKMLPRIAVVVSLVTTIANLAYDPTSIVQWCICGGAFVAAAFYLYFEIELFSQEQNQ